MTYEQIATLVILGVTLVMFIWGRWRYDLVAFCALIVAVFAGVVEPKAAFEGFGHAAVVTVAAVLIITKALAESGAVEILTKYILPSSKNPTLQILYLGGAAAVLSAFMNNIGALALLMPVAIQAAAREGQSPATLLMPLSFASILGGMATQIGTPPNIIIAAYRAEALGKPYAMFDFAPVGALTALIGVVFVVLVGWRLIPRERRDRKPPEELFDIEDYIAEARVPKGAKAIGMSVNEVDQFASDNADIVGLIRKGERITLNRRRKLAAGDILIFESAPEHIASAVKAAGLELIAGGKPVADDLQSDDVEMIEAIVGPTSILDGRTPGGFRLRQRYRVSLLAATRRGKSHKGRLKDFQFQAGDVLLLLGDKDRMPTLLSTLGLLPLAERKIDWSMGGKAGLTAGVFALAIIATALGLATPPVALGAAVAVMILLKIISLSDAYGSIDWSIIVLLGALIPIGGALETTGATKVFAQGIVDWTAGMPAWAILAIVLLVTMTVSDVLNNVATTLLMAPVAVGIAKTLQVNPDAFLMAVAVGASCAFLTPIGHKNNVLVMGPGGYRFGDYWRMGLPLEIIITVVAVPLILIVWPL
ncbi:MAG TPA: SLC13 family permease [Alphaproteobacteria bacterium]|nr:SLC13 family permease [Alphaproteobacteria bacterium]